MTAGGMARGPVWSPCHPATAKYHPAPKQGGTAKYLYCLGFPAQYHPYHPYHDVLHHAAPGGRGSRHCLPSTLIFSNFRNQGGSHGKGGNRQD